MSTSRNETVYLHHTLDAAAEVEEYLQGPDERGFRSPTLVEDAVVRLRIPFYTPCSALAGHHRIV
ncbi:MAG: hypothetical protein AMS18_14475 [Gemmatimonas sp. SG8_17]|nr:MAG: hypothetical protein AMS18_14475 [Gemmatimonas sp. SG8_17]